MISTYSVYRVMLLPLAMLFAAAPANADISISPAVVVFEPKATDQTLLVTNQGSELAFVTAKVRSVTRPGEADEQLRANANPAMLGLLATPTRLVLEPGEQRGLRLLAIGPAGETDRVWRVHVAPAPGNLKPGQSGIAFLIAYDALIIQRAANPRQALVGQRTGEMLTLTNRGNSFVLVTSIEQCREDKCTKLPGKRLYAGQAWSARLPQAEMPATISLEGIGGKKETLRY
jgi:P pilus assembly chaperone PapD